MINIYKPKSLISIILSITLFFTYLPLSAAAPTPPTAPSSDPVIISDAVHKQTIEGFLSEIKTMQRQVFDIAQSALRDPAQGTQQLQIRINLINNNIERLNSVIQDYLAAVPGVSEQNRQVLLTFNVINLVKSSLYTLSLLIRATTDVERITLLDEFFRSRITSLDTLAILEALLERN